MVSDGVHAHGDHVDIDTGDCVSVVSSAFDYFSFCLSWKCGCGHCSVTDDTYWFSYAGFCVNVKYGWCDGVNLNNVDCAVWVVLADSGCNNLDIVENLDSVEQGNNVDVDEDMDMGIEVVKSHIEMVVDCTTDVVKFIVAVNHFVDFEESVISQVCRKTSCILISQAYVH